MKYVSVMIKPFKFEDIREALAKLDIHRIMVTDVRGFGRQFGHSEIYRGTKYSMGFLPKLKLEIAIADQQLEAVLELLCLVGTTGQIGDGKVFVCHLDNALRIRTGQLGTSAL